MAARDELDVESLRMLAENAGLSLTEEEAAELLTGVKRNIQMADVARRVISPETEPASVFRVTQSKAGGE